MKPELREDGRLVLTIKTEKDLRTYMQPLRQKILFELGLRPAGMTAKQLADTLHIAPSSAGHHLGKLADLGLVELARTENIHGITAKFYRATDVTVDVYKRQPPQHPGNADGQCPGQQDQERYVGDQRWHGHEQHAHQRQRRHGHFQVLRKIDVYKRQRTTWTWTPKASAKILWISP